MHFSRQLNCWSLSCSWSMACRRCSNYIFILNLTSGFNGLGKDNYQMRREAFKFWDLVRLILETLRYYHLSQGTVGGWTQPCIFSLCIQRVLLVDTVSLSVRPPTQPSWRLWRGRDCPVTSIIWSRWVREGYVLLSYWCIEAETIWLPFCQWHFQIPFLLRVMYFYLGIM